MNRFANKKEVWAIPSLLRRKLKKYDDYKVRITLHLLFDKISSRGIFDFVLPCFTFQQ